jgi:hypothetical protein
MLRTGPEALRGEVALPGGEAARSGGGGALMRAVRFARYACAVGTWVTGSNGLLIRWPAGGYLGKQGGFSKLLKPIDGGSKPRVWRRGGVAEVGEHAMHFE